MRIVWNVMNASQTSAALQTQLQDLSDQGWIIFMVLPGDGRENDKIIAYKVEDLELI